MVNKILLFEATGNRKAFVLVTYFHFVFDETISAGMWKTNIGYRRGVTLVYSLVWGLQLGSEGSRIWNC